MTSAAWTIIKMLIDLAFIIAIPIYPLFISIFLFFIYYTIRGKRIKINGTPYKKRNFIIRLYFEFPRRFWLDRYERDPDEFQEQGLHLFCGEQGAGKTVSVVHKLMDLQSRYPKLIVRTNFNYKHQNAEVYEWRGLVKNENGVFGQVEVIDEIQTWFSSMQSKDFPPEMLTEISQQRKQRKMLIGTAQVFGRIAKPIREQTTYVYCPITIAGCLTIVRVTKPKHYDDEKCRFKKYIKSYFFVHNPELRDAFDTYKKIDGMIKDGFVPRSEGITKTA